MEFIYNRSNKNNISSNRRFARKKIIFILVHKIVKCIADITEDSREIKFFFRGCSWLCKKVM